MTRIESQQDNHALTRQASPAQIQRERRFALANMLRQARMQWRLGNFRPTRVLCEQVVDTYPACRVAHRLALRAARAEHAWDQHARLIQLPTLVWPRDPQLLLEAARFHLAHGRVKEARIMWSRTGSATRSRYDTQGFEIELLESEGQYRTALALASRCLTHRPHSADLLIKVARLALSANRPDIGSHALNQLIHPPRILQARLLAASHQFHQALDCINSLLAAQPARSDDNAEHVAGPPLPGGQGRSTCHQADYLQARLLRVEWLVALGDLSRIRELAADWCAEADSIETDPFVAEEGVALAEALLNMGQWDDALRLARWCRQADGFIGLRARGLMAAVCTQLNRRRLAALCAGPLRRSRHGTRILAKCHRIAMHGRELADQWALPEDHSACSDPETSVLKPLLERSITILERQVKANPTYADLRYHRANCLAALGRDDEAREDVDVALEINSDYRKAHELHASLCNTAAGI